MDNIDRFDDFINGKLSDEERREFEDKLKTDKEFASDFKLYCLTVIGISREAEQDNRDFGEAMKRISKEELSAIIGARKESTKGQSTIPPIPTQPARFRKWLLWQSIGVAALLGIAVIYIVIAKNEANTVKQSALAMNQEAMDRVDNAIYIFSDYSQGVSRSGGVNIFQLSDDELKAQLPALESDFLEQTDDRVIADDGSELVMAYIRLHERDKAKKLLTDLIARFQNNSDFEYVVTNWQTILKLLE